MGVVLRKKTLKDGRKSLYLDTYRNGRRQYEFLGLHLTGDRDQDKERMRLAEIIRGQREIELFSQAHGLVADHVGRMTLADYCKGKIERKSLMDHVETHFKGLEIRALDDRALAGFQSYLLTTLKPSTVKVSMSLLNAVLNQAVREKVLPRNPGNLMRRIKGQESPTVYLTREEIQALARTPITGEEGTGGRIKKAFLFACFTGFRFSDLQKMTWGEIRGKEVVLTQKKTGGVVRVPLNETAWELINPGDRIPPAKESVFNLGANMAAQYLPAWGKAAGLTKGLHFHVSRHTFATLALEAGADPTTLKSLLGHSHIDMSLHYAKVMSPARKKAVDGMEVDLGKRGSGNA